MDKTIKSYLTGFILCITLTLFSYFIAIYGVLSRNAFLITITGLGIIQAIVQLMLFLHLGKESKPRWKLLMFCFMALVLLILVFGSLWIMHNLNYRVMGM